MTIDAIDAIDEDVLLYWLIASPIDSTVCYRTGVCVLSRSLTRCMASSKSRFNHLLYLSMYYAQYDSASVV